MMRKKVFLRCVVMISCLFLCVGMAGCGIRDSAVVIPIGEAETDASVAEEQDSGDANLDAEHSEGNAAMQKQSGGVQSMICVYVCGAVVNPGVYEIPEGSRVNDALQAAGGFAEDACKDYVNLAAKVTDGEQISFPTIEEAESLESAKEAEQRGLVNINTADAARLMTLPGIGEARAQDIIAYREEHGDFQNKEDLKKVSGIKESMYAKLCDKIIVQ